MIKVTPTGLGAAAVLGTAVAICGCQQAPHPVSFQAVGPPMHEHPHQDWWTYQFIYHPDQQVYFEPYTRTYYWFEHGLWEQGIVLPPSIVIEDTNGKVVHLQTPKPYIQHATVMEWFPNYWGIIPGSTDPYHASPEAIAQSEYRASIRMAATVEELMDVTEGDPTRPRSVPLSMESDASDMSSPESMASVESSSSSESSGEALTSVPASESDVDQ